MISVVTLDDLDIALQDQISWEEDQSYDPDHLGQDHSCTFSELVKDFELGQTWRHMYFRVFTHDPCAETGMTESYLPFMGCNNLQEHYIMIFSAVKRRHKNLDKVLGEPSGIIRECREEDEEYISRQMLTQAAVISFYPGRAGRSGFINRKMFKKRLQPKYKRYVNLARRVPYYRFCRETDEVLPWDEETVQEFWRISRSKEYNQERIETFGQSILKRN